MSAIAGIIRFDGAPVSVDSIEGMLRAQSTRGPDGARHWLDGDVALGHAMLRTTSESAQEQQPVLSARLSKLFFR